MNVEEFMNIKKIQIYFIATCCLISLSMLTKVAHAESKPIGNCYYVSSQRGSDTNSGLSKLEPFKSLNKINELKLNPGDKVLLENGSVFDDQYLQIKNSGNIKACIEISNYGDRGNLPIINTNGKGVWYQDYGKPLPNSWHKYKGNVSSAILLKDVEYIKIKNIEITNDREKSQPDHLAFNDLKVMDRTGVASVAKNKGTLENIVLENLYIHDIDGNIYNKHMANGGIYFISELPDNEEKKVIPKYDNIIIKGNRIKNVSRTGLAVAYSAYFDLFQNSAEIDQELIEKYGNTNVLIENNYIEDAGGDGIVTMYCSSPIIQRNVSNGAGRQMNTTDYPIATQRVAAAMWPWKCKNALFQYNEAYCTKNADQGNGDGQAWDADSADGTIYQYNYSSGNSGGTVMFCLENAVNSTFRFNISQNDKKGILNLPNNPDAHIYNNIFYIDKGVPFVRKDMNTGAALIENNIIYNAGKQPVNEEWNPNNRIIYSNNLYCNYSNLPSSDNTALLVNSQESNIFVSPGNGPVKPNFNYLTYDRFSQNTVFDGYKLEQSSPAIHSGKKVIDKNGYNLGTDFFGIKLDGILDIGAVKSSK